MYVKINNGEVEIFPYSINRLKQENPNISFPKNVTQELLLEYNVYPVEYKIKPEFNTQTQYCIQKNQPELIDDKWVLEWIVYDKSQDQIDNELLEQSELIRYKRNEALRNCDWTVLPDSPLESNIKTEWITYRRSLRDISSHTDFPWVDLPNPPGYIEPELDPLTGVEVDPNI